MQTQDTAALSDTTNHMSMTADLVAAYVSNNHVQSGELTTLINTVHAALSGLGGVSVSAEPVQEKASAAAIRKSITPDYLISFEDGKQYKTLRRHLTLRGLTGEQYRAKWGLAADYPMTSASYSAQRSELARSLGLGQQRRKGTASATAETPAKGRGKKAPQAAAA